MTIRPAIAGFLVHDACFEALDSVRLAVTGTIGSLCYAAWAVTDRIVAGRLGVSPDGVEAPVTVTPTSA